MIAVTILLATRIEVTIGTGNTGGAVPLGDENSTTLGRIRKAVQDTGLLGLCKCRQAQEGTRFIGSDNDYSTSNWAQRYEKKREFREKAVSLLFV